MNFTLCKLHLNFLNKRKKKPGGKDMLFGINHSWIRKKWLSILSNPLLSLPSPHPASKSVSPETLLPCLAEFQTDRCLGPPSPHSFSLSSLSLSPMSSGHRWALSPAWESQLPQILTPHPQFTSPISDGSCSVSSPNSSPLHLGHPVCGFTGCQYVNYTHLLHRPPESLSRGRFVLTSLPQSSTSHCY